MSNGKECGCDYLNVDTETFKKYPTEIAVVEAIEILPALFHQKRDFKKVIRIAALLPTKEEMNETLKKNERSLERLERDITVIKESNTKKLNATIHAIEGSFANVLVNSPFTEQEDIIKFLSQYAKQHELGMNFWKKRLLAHLCGDPKNTPLNQIEYWNSYYDNIKTLISEFGLPEEDFKKILIAVAEEKKHKSPVDCINALIKMGVPVNYNAYLEVADNYMKAANEKDCKCDRRTYAIMACELYEFIGKNFEIGSRQKILKIWIIEEKESYPASKKTIETSSEIIGFKYKPLSFWNSFK